MTKLRPSEISRDLGLQPREKLSQRDVERYKAAYLNKEALPAPVVFQVGDKHGLTRGYHRLAAWILAFGDEPIECDVKPGSIDDAKEDAAFSNQEQDKHGVARTDGDKGLACQILLSTEKWKNKSGRDIAKAVGCSEITARRAKEKVSASTVADTAVEVTRTRNGKTQTYKQKRRKVGPRKTHIQPMQPVRDAVPMQRMANLNIPHDAALAAGTLARVFDRTFLAALADEITKLLGA